MSGCRIWPTRPVPWIGCGSSGGSLFTALAALSTRQIAASAGATGMEENQEAGKKGGGITKKARRELEAKMGKKVVPGDNFLPAGARRP